MHLVSEPVARLSGVPLIDIIDETALALRADARRRPLLLATRYTMEHGFYAQRMARHGIEVVTPCATDRGRVHDVIFDELCQDWCMTPRAHAYSPSSKPPAARASIP